MAVQIAEPDNVQMCISTSLTVWLNENEKKNVVTFNQYIGERDWTVFGAMQWFRETYCIKDDKSSAMQ